MLIIDHTPTLVEKQMVIEKATVIDKDFLGKIPI